MTIVFAGADVDTRTNVQLEGHARFLGWEVVVLGRPAADESFAGGRLVQTLQVRRDGARVLASSTP